MPSRIVRQSAQAIGDWRFPICDLGLRSSLFYGPQPSGCFNVLSLGASIFSDAWAFPGRHLSSNTESDLNTNVVRTLKQPEGCGPSESAVLNLRGKSSQARNPHCEPEPMCRLKLTGHLMIIPMMFLPGTIP
jgi:hypothetical protein